MRLSCKLSRESRPVGGSFLCALIARVCRRTYDRRARGYLPCWTRELPGLIPCKMQRIWQRKGEELPRSILSSDTWHCGLPQTSHATRSYTYGVMQVIYAMLAGPPLLHFSGPRTLDRAGGSLIFASAWRIPPQQDLYRNSIDDQMHSIRHGGRW